MSEAQPARPAPNNYYGFRIDSLWAWTCIGNDNQEGLLTITTTTGQTLPLVASDKARLDQFRPWAQGIATAAGRPVRLRKFDGGETLEELQP